MNKIYLTLLLFLSAVTSFAGDNYEKGFIIDNAGNKKVCLINNCYWLNNPSRIEYKTGTDSKIQIAKVSDLLAFEIYDYGRFERHVVKVALPEQAVENSKHFIWETDTLFLTVILKGDPSLYYYKNGYTGVYFYQRATDSIPVQFQYRESQAEGVIVRDFMFRNQLNVLGKDCAGLAFGWVDKVGYNVDDLTVAIKEMNRCSGSQATIYKRKKRTFFVPHLEASAGIKTTSLDIKSGKNTANFDYSSGNKMGLRVGAALELESLVYLRKCSMLFEAAYQGFSDRQVISGANQIKVKMNGIALNFGIRKYFTIFPQTRLFVEGFVNLHTFYFQPEIEYLYYYSYSKIENPIYDLKVRTFGDFSLGGGCSYRRLGAELRYILPHDVAANNDNWGTSYKGFQGLVKVRLF